MKEASHKSAKHCMIPLTEAPRAARFIEPESRMMVTGGCREGEMVGVSVEWGQSRR